MSFFVAGLGLAPHAAFGQNAISTGTKAGFRMFYTGNNDWWLDPSKGNFDIRMNGNPAMATLNSSGYLGIGTTNPTLGDLQLSGNPNIGAQRPRIALEDTAGSGQWLIQPWYFAGDGNLSVLRNAGSGNLLLAPNGGSVGIGTTNPAYRLVISQGGARGLEIDTADTQISGGIGLQAYNRQTAAYVPIQLYGSSVLLNGGNVGIGVPNPQAQLAIAGSAGGQLLRLAGAGGYDNGFGITSKITDNSDGSPLNLFYTAHTNTVRSNDIFRIHSNETGSGSLAFHVTTGGAVNAPAYQALSVLSSNGYVGIGTAAPSAALQLNGSGGFTAVGAARFDISNPTIAATFSQHVGLDPTFGAFWQLADAAGGQTKILVSTGTNGSINFFNGTGNVVIQGTGKVGIGTTAPGQSLDIAGTAQMTGFKMPTGAANGYVLTSDPGGAGTWQPASGGVTGSGASGQVAFWSGTASQTGDSNLFWDNTNKRLGIGGASGGIALDVIMTGTYDGIRAKKTSDTAGAAPILYFDRLKSASAPSTGDTLGWIRFRGVVEDDAWIQAVVDAAAGGSVHSPAALLFFTNPATGLFSPLERMRITSGGFVGIGTGAPSTALTVYGVITSSSPAPGISCDAAPASVSANNTNQSGEFTMGNGGSRCTITFSAAWPKKPSCFCNDQTTTRMWSAGPISTTSVTCDDHGVNANGEIINYFCFASP